MCLSMGVCTWGRGYASGVQKRTLGSLELEFQVVVSSLTGDLEANLGLLCKNSIKILFTEACRQHPKLCFSFF